LERLLAGCAWACDGGVILLDGAVGTDEFAVLETLLNELLVLQLVRLPAQITHLLHRLVSVLG